MKEEDIEKSNNWYQKYGLIAALIGRNFPIVRTLISLPIGTMHLSFIKFFLYTLVGSIPWTFAFVYVGYALGNNWIIINEYINKLKMPIKILLIILLVSYFYKNIRQKLNKKRNI